MCTNTKTKIRGSFHAIMQHFAPEHVLIKVFDLGYGNLRHCSNPFDAITVLKGKLLTLVFIQDNRLPFSSALHNILTR